MKCVICSSINKKKNIKYFYKHLKKKYFKCFNCEFVFQYPLPTNSELTKYYNKSYFEKNYYIKNKEYNLRNKQYILDKKILLKYFDDKKNKKIFDYGCGNGEFLKKFKSKKFGYEFNKNAKVSNKIKILKLNEIKGKTFDLIIMRGVIEHITNFDEIIKKLSKSLKKNGLFYITATPNTNNLTFFFISKKFQSK